MKLEKLYIAGLVMLLIFVGVSNCSKQSSIAEPPKETPIEEPVAAPSKPECKSGVWCYDSLVMKALDTHGASLLKSNPKDASSWCKNLNSTSVENKKIFYTKLIQALAYFESSYKPETSYQENFKDQQGKFIISRGLLQLSKESSNASIYKCGTTNEQMLHDPEFNLNCGMKIFAKWVVDDGVIQGNSNGWRGAARYWSPFRKSDRILSMKKRVQELEFCR